MPTTTESGPVRTRVRRTCKSWSRHKNSRTRWSSRRGPDNPYGTVAQRSGSATSPFGYDGEYTDRSGLLYLRARYYDPVSAQFLTVDPAVALTEAPYAFVAGDPINTIDPSGLRPIDPDGAHYYGSSSPSPEPGNGVFGPQPPSAGRGSPADALIRSGTRVGKGNLPKTADSNSVLYKTDSKGNVTNYEVYDQDGNPLYRVDVTGRSHNGIDTPHVQEFVKNTNKQGKVFFDKGVVRPAKPSEVPTETVKIVDPAKDSGKGVPCACDYAPGKDGEVGPARPGGDDWGLFDNGFGGFGDFIF